MSKRNPISASRLVLDGVCAGRYRTEVSKRVISSLAAGAGVGFGVYVINDLPVGDIIVHGAVARLAFRKLDANIIATWSGNFAIGSAPDADGTHAGGEVDLIPSTAIGAAVGGLITATRVPNILAAPLNLNNRNGSLEINLNLIVAAASQTDATTGLVQVDGVLDLYLQVMP